MKYAIVRIKGKQYLVREGDELLVNKLNSDKVEYDVLMYRNEKKVEVGSPNLDKVKLTFKILGDEKGEKIHVRKFKAKSRYRKHIGYRASLSRIEVTKIS